jgi:hypothetical protein
VLGRFFERPQILIPFGLIGAQAFGPPRAARGVEAGQRDGDGWRSQTVGGIGMGGAVGIGLAISVESLSVSPGWCAFHALFLRRGR